MSRTLLAAAGSLILGVAACVPPIDVRAVRTPGVDFAQYATVRVERSDAAPRDFVASRRSNEVRDQVAEMTVAILASKGYGLAASGKADLVVRVAVGRRPPDIPRTAPPRFGMESMDYDSVLVEVVVIDAFVAQTGARVWYGISRDDVDPNRTDFSQLRRALGALFDSFPARSPPPSSPAPLTM